MKTRKTTQKDFDVFKSEIERLLDKFHISDWRVKFSLEKLENSNAECSTHSVTRICSFYLSTEIDLFNDDEIKETALHEICHLLVADIGDLVNARFVTSDEVYRAAEVVARKLGSIFMMLNA